MFSTAAAPFYLISLYGRITAEVMDLPILFIHSPFDGHFSHFYLLALVNSAAMNILVYFFLFEHLLFNSLGSISRSGVVEP